MKKNFIKTFTYFFLPVCLGLSISAYIEFLHQKDKIQSDFNSKYQNKTKVYGNVIRNIETYYEKIMWTAINGIKNTPTKEVNTKTIKELTKTFGVTHAFVIDSKGKFILSSNEDPKNIPNLFIFSKDYKSLPKSRKSYLTTPIIIPFPEKVPHKFLTIWDENKNRYIEIGVRIKEIAKDIKNNLFEDTNINSVNISISNTPFKISAENITGSEAPFSFDLNRNNPLYTQSNTQNSHD